MCVGEAVCVYVRGLCVCVFRGCCLLPSPLPPLWGQASVPIHGLGSTKRRPHQRVPELWLAAGGSAPGVAGSSHLGGRGAGVGSRGLLGPSSSLGFRGSWGPGGSTASSSLAKTTGRTSCRAPWGWACQATWLGSGEAPSEPPFLLSVEAGVAVPSLSRGRPVAPARELTHFPSAAQLAHEPVSSSEDIKPPLGLNGVLKVPAPPLREHGVLHHASVPSARTAPQVSRRTPGVGPAGAGAGRGRGGGGGCRARGRGCRARGTLDPGGRGAGPWGPGAVGPGPWGPGPWGPEATVGPGP